MNYDQWELMSRFQDQYRVQRDPEEPDRLPMIPLKAKRGHVYVHGADRLGAVYRSCASMVRSMAADFSFAEVVEGDREHLIIWPLDHPDGELLMGRIGAMRRPRVSQAMRRERSERMRRQNAIKNGENRVRNRRTAARATQTSSGAI